MTSLACELAGGSAGLAFGALLLAVYAYVSGRRRIRESNAWRRERDRRWAEWRRRQQGGHD